MDVTVFNTIARELPLVGAFLVLIVFVLNWMAKYIGKRDGEWQSFLSGLDTNRDKRDVEWREFLEKQNDLAMKLTAEYHNQTVDIVKGMSDALSSLKGSVDKANNMADAHDKKFDIAVAEMKASIGRRKEGGA